MSSMTFTEATIKNFRGIRTCELKDFGLVNIFFGKNNCGKSSLLEALFLMSGPSNPTMPIVINNLRNLRSFTEDDIKVDFYGLNPNNEIILSSKGRQARNVRVGMIESHSRQISLEELGNISVGRTGKRYGFKIDFTVDQDTCHHHTELIITDGKEAKAKTDNSYKESLYAEYIPPGNIQVNINEKLAQIVKDKRESDIVDVLRCIEPRIKDIQLVENDIMVDIGLSSRIPLKVLGDGVSRALSILVSVHNAKNGVLMIDEMDNGLHYSVMRDLWRSVLFACQKYNTQLFVTTHSADLINGLVCSVECGATDSIEVSAYKLVRKENDELVALRYGKAELTYVIKQEMEVR